MNKAGSFGALLQRLRRAAGLSQEDLARRAELSVNAVQALEAGRRKNPRLDTVNRLASGLGLSLQEHAAFRAAATGDMEEPTPAVDSATRLPAPTTALVGRVEELAEISALLTRDRLVTLIGPGGVGKTRLAIAVAAATETDYGDGAVFVDLAPLHDHRLVVATLAQALGLKETRGHSPQTLLKTHLRQHHVLLVLDNFEHVVEAGSFIAELLRDCPRVAVLSTSRVPLHIRSEQVHLVEPLGLPPHDWLDDLDSLARSDAVALFVQCARSQRRQFALTTDNGRAVAEICRRMDGLPLAIELVAAHSRTLSPQSILERFTDPLNLTGPHDLPSRQQTLIATLDWSYELLDERARTFFCYLGVFASTFDLRAVEAVVVNADVDAVACLETLIDHSLVRSDERGEDRFSMLQTIREYAWARLSERGDRADMQRRHAGYYLSFADEAAANLRGPRQRQWLARLETEHDNLRLALTSAIAQGAEVAGRLVAALWPFWVAHGHLTEGTASVARVLTSSAAPSCAVHARVLNGGGVLAWQQGDFDAAHTFFARSLELASSCGAEREMAETLKWLGNLAIDTGHQQQALDLYTRSRDMYESLDDTAGTVDVLSNLGIVYRRMARWDDALAVFDKALALRTLMGHQWGVGSSHNNRAEVLRSRGDRERRDLDAAIVEYEEAIRVWKSGGYSVDVALALTGLGMARVENGDLAGGRRDLMDAEARFRELSSARYLPDLYRFLASTELASDNVEQAGEYAARSYELASGAGAITQEGMTERVLAQIALARDDPRLAEQLLESSQRKLAGAGELGELARTNLVLQTLQEKAPVVEC